MNKALRRAAALAFYCAAEITDAIGSNLSEALEEIGELVEGLAQKPSWMEEAEEVRAKADDQ